MGNLLPDLLELIYDAPLHGGAWEAPLAGITKALNATAGVLLFQDRSPGTPPNHGDMAAMVGLPEHAAALYYGEFAADDYRIAEALGSPSGTVFADEWNLDYDRYLRSRIFNEFYRPLGVDRITSIRLFEGNRIAILSAFAAPDRNAWTADDLRLLGLLGPHLVRSLQLKRQVDRAEAVAAGLQLGLDHFALAVLLLDGRGRLATANRAAEAMLARLDAPLRMRTGRLTAPFGSDDAALLRHLAAAGDREQPPAPVLRLRSRDGSAIFSLMAVRTAGPFPGTLIFVNDPGVASPLAPGVLAAQFGLSAAEAEVVAALCTGTVAAEIAERRSVGVTTIRSQIKAAFAKTGTNTQGGLIALASRSLAALIQR